MENKAGRLPNGFLDIPIENISRLAKTGSDESDALASLGLQPYQVERAKKLKRWRRAWDKARAEWVLQKNAEISGSGDVRILSLLASKTMPENDLGERVIFTVDAPEWFTKPLDKEKRSARVKVNS